jgi:hypothetical protein
MKVTRLAGRRLRMLILGAAMVGGALVAPAPSEAGTYEALSCDQAPPGGADDAWEPFGAAPATRLYRQCPSGANPGRGMVAAHFSRTNNGQKSGWRFVPPPHTSLSQIQATINGRRYGDDNLGSGLYSPESSPTARHGFNPGGGGARAYGPGLVTVGLPTGTRELAAGVFCGSSRSCIPDPGSAEVDMHLTGARVTVVDELAPTLELRGGTIVDREEQSGPSNVVFAARDNVGIRDARLLIDGEQRDRLEFPCDYSRRIPCADQSERKLSVDSRGLASGPHTARVEVTDAAGNRVGQERRLVVSNPVASNPVVSNPVASNPVASNPVASNPVAGTRVGATGIALRVSRGRVRNGKRVMFTGVVSDEQGPVNRVLVTLQAKVGRKWVTFRTVRTDERGIYGARYRFTRTFRTRTYSFRARVSAQAGVEADSNSRRVRVKVRGG